MPKYALGIDYGTLSVRALVADTATGREIGQAVMDYPHGVMDKSLPDGQTLPPDWALAHPGDYIECLSKVVPQALAHANIRPEDIAGVGVDGTTCTLLPVDEAGEPLCLMPRFAGDKHAWPKLWKHHAAQAQAERMTEAARDEAFLKRYGGRASSEWLFPKLLQTFEEAPQIYEAADQFLDAPDWIVRLLTGRTVRSGCLAGYKAFYDRERGYPDAAFFARLNPRFDAALEKLGGEVVPVGGRAGLLSRAGARLTGLNEGTPVAVASSDAHVTLPAAGVTQPGTMLMIMGTSTVDILLGREERDIPGICGTVDGGVTPGLWGYEAGQCCVGDHFGWFVENAAPQACAEEAARRGCDLHTLLTEKAARLAPGESGLVALDWYNGNRSILNDASLSGLIVGMTLTTPPEAVYRALMEATAYGARVILENFTAHGAAADEIVACGGIARKNPFMMQMYADVLGRDIRIAKSAQTSALGSAILGAVAAGKAAGGWDSIPEAAAAMGGVSDTVYRPDAAAHAVYDRLYGEYLTLHDYFGRGGNGVMARLKAVRREASR